MNGLSYSDEQRLEYLKEWEELQKDMSGREAAKIIYSKHGVPRTTLLKWKKKFFPNDTEIALDQRNYESDNWTTSYKRIYDEDGQIQETIIVKNQDIPSADEMILRFSEAIGDYKGEYRPIEREKIEDGHLLIVDVADIHVGKLCTASFTGEEYNIEKAKQGAVDGMKGILQKTSGFNLDQIALIIGNDALHIDSPKRTTTAGTHQDTSGTWFDAFIAAREMYVEMIETLVTVADLQVIFNPSNHDYMSGAMLADSLKSWFRDAPNIQFQTDMRHRKYFQYGLSLIGTTHGDGAKEGDLGEIMAHESGQMWVDTKFRYWYCHHLHHKIAKDKIGYTIEYTRSPSPADRWHADNGYLNTPAAEGYLHSKDKGQIARLTHYL